ncbi:TatD family hydrolase [Candidatus Burkholderia verschuerenii]|uniref:TatD family hydrolase n=1 Tax=Candidatus Burkholderia verschuerenii TaxID=242163 RepID=UPI0018DCD99E|nr:TatD family hydrolase [Candidatus Burkholderia verschuerenii]
MLNNLERHPGFGVAVLHWFSGSQRELARAVEMGCWFSVGAAMLRGQKGRALAERMPPDRVVTETDGPFGATSGRALEPAECGAAITVLASLWGVDEEGTKRNILESFRELVRI